MNTKLIDKVVNTEPSGLGFISPPQSLGLSSRLVHDQETFWSMDRGAL
jgi:hypothetical protein